MVDIIKLCGVALLAAFAGMILKQLKGEFAPLLRVGAIILIFGAVALWTWDILSEVSEIVGADGFIGYSSVMFKALGISLLTKICSDICRDCGESGIAGGVELGGKLTILSLCLPIIRELVGYAVQILKFE